MEISERIDYLIKSLCHDNGKAFAQEIGAPPSSVSKWRKGARQPGYNALEKILKAFPAVRKEWLFEGKGKPLLGERIERKTSEKEVVKRLEQLEKKVDQLLSLMKEYR